MDGHGRTFLLLEVFFSFVVFASTGENKQDCSRVLCQGPPTYYEDVACTPVYKNEGDCCAYKYNCDHLDARSRNIKKKRVSEKENVDCSQVLCQGPLTYYEDVGCTPVYKNEGDCCAYKYNCDHLDARSRNKCYIKQRSYEIDEFYGYDENSPCNLGCYCSSGATSARFNCAIADCFYPSVDDGCYLDRNVTQCCPGSVICPKNGSKIPECVVDGVTYKGREIFTPKNEPRKRCSCREGYTGDNIEPFCITTSTRCSTDLYYNEDIANKCAPTYDSDQNPATSCSQSWRCQNANDTVIPNPNGPTPHEENSCGGKGLTCKFGNLTMNLGDELNQNTGYNSDCVRCVCEVPPTPTCRRLSDCNVATGRN